jgi:hypothetical protein
MSTVRASIQPGAAEPLSQHENAAATNRSSLLLLRRAVREKVEEKLAFGVVAVAVDDHEPLPGAEDQSPAADSENERRADQSGQKVISAVSGGSMPVLVLLGPR